MLKILLKPGQKVYFTSDTHYGHTNIVRGKSKWSRNTRDFKSVEESNKKLKTKIILLITIWLRSVA